MPKLLPNLIAATFVVATFSAYAADDEQSGSPGVEQAANAMDQDSQGDAQSSASENANQDAVTSPLPTGDGRSDNQ
jgi:hypothetical protein